jgi:hypothetical protein
MRGNVGVEEKMWSEEQLASATAICKTDSAAAPM